MSFEKFTVKAQEALQSAGSIQNRFDHSAIDIEHLVLALLEQSDGVIPPLLDRLGASRTDLQHEIEQRLEKKPRIFGETSQPTLSAARGVRGRGPKGRVRKY